MSDKAACRKFKLERLYRIRIFLKYICNTSDTCYIMILIDRQLLYDSD